MELTSEAARFLPLVKNLASEIHQKLVPDIDPDELFHSGLKGLSDGFSEFRSRQGLTQRIYLIYRIRSAIYRGLDRHHWRTDSSRLQYLFLKKATELLLNFHLSAEAATKRTLKAEEEELFQLVEMLTIVAFLSQPGLYHIDFQDFIQTLEGKEGDLIRYHYLEDLDLKHVSTKLGLSEAAVFRLHLQTLQKLGRTLVSKFA